MFTAVCIFFFVAPGTIIGDSCKEGSKTELIKNLYETDVNATKVFCHEECPCSIKKGDSDLAKHLIANGYSVNVGNTTNKNYQACMDKDTDESSVLLMGTLEELLGCGGWCENKDHYTYFFKYSDINNCVDEDCFKNKNSCYFEFKSFL